MRYWDSSAIIPLLVEEPTTREVQKLLAADTQVATWWGTETECASALARLEREGALTVAQVSECFVRLDALCASWREVQAVPQVRRTARRLLRLHPLRAADALQLAAALTLAGPDPTATEVVCLDQRLRDAALREGFRVAPRPV